MDFKSLDPRTRRERINLSQLWQAWIEAEDLRRHYFRGSMGFEARSGKDYLYRRIGGTGRSLGPRSEHTEEKLARFKASREEIRHSLMVAWMNEMRRKAATRTMLTREIAKLSTLFRQH